MLITHRCWKGNSIHGHNGRCLCHSPTIASPSPSFVGQHFYCDVPTIWLLIHDTLSTFFGMVRAAHMAATPTATHKKTVVVPQDAKCSQHLWHNVGTVMKMPARKTLEWICLNCMCTELSKLSNYCPNVRNSVCSRVLGRWTQLSALFYN